MDECVYKSVKSELSDKENDQTSLVNDNLGDKTVVTKTTLTRRSRKSLVNNIFM